MVQVDKKVEKVGRALGSLCRPSGVHLATRMMLEEVDKDGG